MSVFAVTKACFDARNLMTIKAITSGTETMEITMQITEKKMMEIMKMEMIKEAVQAIIMMLSIILLLRLMKVASEGSITQPRRHTPGEACLTVWIQVVKIDLCRPNQPKNTRALKMYRNKPKDARSTVVALRERLFHYLDSRQIFLKMKINPRIV